MKIYSHFTKKPENERRSEENEKGMNAQSKDLGIHACLL